MYENKLCALQSVLADKVNVMVKCSQFYSSCRINRYIRDVGTGRVDTRVGSGQTGTGRIEIFVN